jgi:hypothetical protein
MEKINVEQEFKKYDGDFIPLPSTFRILGFKSLAYKKNGTEKIATVVIAKREDGEEITLFADQLRKEGDVLLVSSAHLQAQIARQEAYKATKGRPK